MSKSYYHYNIIMINDIETINDKFRPQNAKVLFAKNKEKFIEYLDHSIFYLQRWYVFISKYQS